VTIVGTRASKVPLTTDLAESARARHNHCVNQEVRREQELIAGRGAEIAGADGGTVPPVTRIGDGDTGFDRSQTAMIRRWPPRLQHRHARGPG
jgi:hypothetical protein